MLRCTKMAMGLIVILSMMDTEARAQWGFGGWGFDGWGVGTPEGAALHGAADFAMGAGMYNLKTAQAMSIDADTAMRFNDYVAQITREEARTYWERVNQRGARNRELHDARQKQLRDSPTRRDIEMGDALNAAVADLDDPRISRSALLATKAPIPASLIAEVPFIIASRRITLMMEGLRASVKWPDVFDDQKFAADQKTFDDLAARLRQQASDGDLSSQTLQEATGFMSDLGTRLEAQPLKDPNHQKEALKFITACTWLVGLLQKPDIGPAILALRKVQNTMVGNLLGFMNAYNLRFGPATTPKQREVYGQLFEILDTTRDRILAEAKLDSAPLPNTNPTSAEDFFQKLDQGSSRAGASAQPRRPQNPR